MKPEKIKDFLERLNEESACPLRKDREEKNPFIKKALPYLPAIGALAVIVYYVSCNTKPLH